MISEVRWNKSTESPLNGPHLDFADNLRNANLFCKRTEKALLPGMRNYISNSVGLENSLLMIAFIPPKLAPMGNYVTPIFLHQSKTLVNFQIESIFNIYLKTARKFWDGQPKMVQQEIF